MTIQKDSRTEIMTPLERFAAYPQLITMGNLSTILLETGDPEKVASRTETLVREGIDIISPACGLSTSTSIKTIRAMTDTVKEA